MTPLESIIVQKMGAAIWRQVRLWSFDQVRLARECAKIRQSSSEADLNPLTIGALAFHSILQATGTTNSFQIHEMRYDRQFSIALNQLNRLQKMRQDPPSSAPLRDPDPAERTQQVFDSKQIRSSPNPRNNPPNTIQPKPPLSSPSCPGVTLVLVERVGRFQIVQELGRGAMGVVYQAIDPTIGRSVAIKTIRLREVDDSEQRSRLRERLFREARSAGVLSHPNIVTIYDMDEEDGLAYIAMQFVNGPTVEALLDGPETAPPKALTPEAIFRILRQTASALDFAHSKGIVHRDIKPANIMIDEDGTVKIADFGIAKASAAGNLTASGTILGTPNYMSPEQVQGSAIDGRSDQFSLGVVAYEILTGERPFPGENLGTVIYRIVAEPAIEPAQINPALGPEIGRVLQRALQKNPKRRFLSCTEFINQLHDACEATPGWHALARTHGIPTDSTAPTPIAKRPRRKTTSSLTAAPEPPAPKPETVQPPPSMVKPALGAFAVVLAILALVAWQTNGPPEEPRKLPAAPSAEDVETPPAPAPAPAPAQSLVIKTAPKRSPFAASPLPASVLTPIAPPEKPLQDVWVVTVPPGATATLDGHSESACQTPCLLLSEPGVHILFLALKDHQPERRQLRIGDSREDVPLINLRPAGGTLIVSSVPPGANIFLDDKMLAELTPAQINLQPGHYNVAVERDGNRKLQQVTIKSGATNYLRIPFTP